MIHQPRHDIPENHPLRSLFWTLTERGMGQLNHRDQEVVQYLTDLLTEFVHRDNLNRIATDSGERLHAFSDMLDQSALANASRNPTRLFQACRRRHAF